MSISYNIYVNDGAGGPVDYTTIHDTASGLTWESAALAYPGVWKFAVRAVDSVEGEEKNIDALVKFQLDASGVDISAMPDAPVAISGHARANGAISIDWAYKLTDMAKKPTGFHVYQGTGGTPSYGSPVATVAWNSSQQFYTTTITGLTDGTAYTFGVRAYNATGEETNTKTTTVTADASGPPNIFNLAGSAVS